MPDTTKMTAGNEEREAPAEPGGERGSDAGSGVTAPRLPHTPLKASVRPRARDISISIAIPTGW